MSFEAVQRPQIEKVFYNELNSGVVALLKDVLENGVTDKYYKWVDRETFMKHKEDKDWFGGLCKVIWSFGNNQTAYMFGKDKENYKRLFHEFVVNKCNKSRAELELLLEIKIPSLSALNGINERRLWIQNYIKRKASIKDKELQYLEEVNKLQNLTQIEQLSRLQHLEHLNISNKSYDEVDITTPAEETIIFLDPPYENTAEYEKGGFDHKKLKEWIKTQKCKVYISSYQFDGFIEVMKLEHRSLLASNSLVKEKLFLWDGLNAN